MTQHYDTATGNKIDKLPITDGNTPVRIDGAVTAASGSVEARVMQPVTIFTGTAAKENYQDSTGCKAFWVEPGIVITGGDALIIAWSTTANDTATTQAACVAVKAAITAPDGAAHPNVVVISDISTDLVPIYWDGENTIKTISFLTSAAPAATYSPILHTVG